MGSDIEREQKRKKDQERGRREMDVREGERGLYFEKDCNKSARLISDVGSQKHDHWTSLLFLKTHYLSHSCFITYFGCKKLSWKVESKYDAE